jgi:hypothetical protein
VFCILKAGIAFGITQAIQYHFKLPTGVLPEFNMRIFLIRSNVQHLHACDSMAANVQVFNKINFAITPFTICIMLPLYAPGCRKQTIEKHLYRRCFRGCKCMSRIGDKIYVFMFSTFQLLIPHLRPPSSRPAHHRSCGNHHNAKWKNDRLRFQKWFRVSAMHYRSFTENQDNTHSFNKCHLPNVVTVSSDG